MDYIVEKYNYLSSESSDINEHLPTLCKYATECESILELGVRGCISSWAFVKGLMENNKPKKQILLNDLSYCDINELLFITRDIDILTVNYEWINDLEITITENVDMTFIDTWHIYGQLKRELAKFSKVTNKYIIMHDTTVDEIYGEVLRYNSDGVNESLSSGYPIEEVTCGLQKAIDEFLESNKDWVLHERYANNNGLTILKRID
jgi:hypothetical protein